MATVQLSSAPPETAELSLAPSGRVSFGTAMVHTWYLTGRKLHALVRQPWVLAFSIVQPVIWLFLFGQLFKKIIDIPGFAYHGSYLDYLVPGLIAMNAMSNNMWAGMSMIEEIERGTLNRFLVSPASRIGIMLRSREAIIGVYTFFMLPLMFLSSAFIYTQLMPGWMQAIASCNPLNWVVQVGRSAVSAQPDWSVIAVRCGGLLVLAVACVAVSVVTFRSYQKNV
jgi:ABC-type multidrug transport system permease subunit